MVDVGLLLRMETETLAQRLKRLRVAKGLSQNALGTEAHLLSGGQAIYKVEAGQRSFQPDTARRVAAVLETTPEYLLYGFKPTFTGELPPLDTCLRETSPLRDDDIHAVTHLVRRLSESATRYETEDEDEKTRQLRRAGELIEEYRTRTAGNPDAETDADRAAYKGEIPPAPNDHGQA